MNTSLTATPKLEDSVSHAFFDRLHCLVSELPMPLCSDNSIFIPNYTLHYMIHIDLHFKQTLCIPVHRNCTNGSYQDVTRPFYQVFDNICNISHILSYDKVFPLQNYCYTCKHCDGSYCKFLRHKL